MKYYMLLYLLCLYTNMGAQSRQEQIDPKFSQSTFWLIMEGKTDQAMRRIDSALTVNSKNRDAIYLKIQIYQQRKDIEGIKRQADLLLSIDTVVKREGNVFRGAIEEYTNSYKAALPYYQKARSAKIKSIPAEYKDPNPLLIDYLIDNDKQKLKTLLVELFGKEEWAKRVDLHWVMDYSRKEMLESIIGIHKINTNSKK